MGESLHCDLCGKPATVHLTQIIKNQIQKVDLCEDCAQSKGVTGSGGLLAGGFAGQELCRAQRKTQSLTSALGPTLVCEQMRQLVRSDFKKTGRFGLLGML